VLDNRFILLISTPDLQLNPHPLYLPLITLPIMIPSPKAPRPFGVMSHKYYSIQPKVFVKGWLRALKGPPCRPPLATMADLW
jgi:hypothetical protein